MATKTAAVGNKRKAAPSGKPKSDPKKARLSDRTRQKPVEKPEDSSDDGSDSEEGGAKLSDEAPKKDFKSSNGKPPVQGMQHSHPPPSHTQY